MSDTGKHSVLALSLLWALFAIAANPSLATTYYVDYNSGSDANNGTSKTTPWKHSPGDPVATGNPLSVALTGGDNVVFKGGVCYRGNIVAKADGAASNPISYQGNAWGADKAILDGSEVLTGSWTKCASASECRENPNWNNIHYITAPAGYVFFAGLFEDDQPAHMSQYPNQTDPFFYDRIEAFRKLPVSDPATSITTTSITDPGFFTQSDPNFWNSAYVGVWRMPNVIVLRTVTSYGPTSHTLYFQDIDGTLYAGQDGLYTLLNNPYLIDMPGEYAFDQGKLFIWPFSSEDPNLHTYTYAKRRVGIQLGGRSNIVVEGLVIQKYFGGPGDFNDGAGVRIVSSTTTSTAITIRNNEITKLRSMEKKGGVTISGKANDILVLNNNIHMNQRNGGVLAGGTKIVIKDNIVQKVATGITFMEAKNSQILHNEVSEILHSHSNGITVYLNSSNVLVAHNRVTNSPYYALTLQASGDITVFGNILDGGSGTCQIGEFSGGSSGQIAFLHNLIVGSDTNSAVAFLGGKGASSYVMINNIIDGGGTDPSIIRKNNIYLGLRWDQATRYGWSLAEGESVVEDQTQLFISPGTKDYHYVPTSPAINAGADVSAYLPKTTFPDFDFGRDYDGNSRPQDGKPDIGPYERPISDATAPSIPQNPAAVAVSESQINLTWDSSSDNVGVMGYQVYRDSVFLTTCTITSHQDKGLLPTSMHSYTVKAFDATRNVSGPSASASATTLSDTTSPEAPQNVKAKPLAN